MGKNVTGQLKIEMFHVFGLFCILSFKCQIFYMQFLQNIVSGNELDKEADITMLYAV